ncbi:LPS assembly lipoprotein LptE [Lentisphaera profundi]|uniref:LPS assembly lipoprotein LptE n=1 Tax=Lentisphaera profundi TaxID=1658616 RepID=A0ABY7VMY6_9BACT|nr:LPS assembly lipoprotein LptE [Lentisphaera profundi]WDE95430.1 LPS assembly lipoprotein LptE [Lentisphaera profundi]
MIKRVFLSLLFALILSSCSGYQIGDIGHPQIKKVSIGKITNLSNEPRLSLFMMAKLKEAILQDGTYELVNAGEGKAHAIIQGTVPQFTYQQRGFSRNDDDKDNYRVDNYRVTVSFDYEVVTPKKLLIQKFKLSGHGEFSEGLSIDQDRREGLERACYNLSTKVITQLSEGW